MKAVVSDSRQPSEPGAGRKAGRAALVMRAGSSRYNDPATNNHLSASGPVLTGYDGNGVGLPARRYIFTIHP